ncbi:hypothetical protein MTY414_56530 [Mycolicibacterium mageritense]|nr:hypothetical protein MTY414_56530 [Mycolicibacterium mageritense]
MQGHRLRIRCGLRRENFSETLATLTENFPPETLHYTPQPAVTTLPETKKEWQQTPDGSGASRIGAYVRMEVDKR